MDNIKWRRVYFMSVSFEIIPYNLNRKLQSILIFHYIEVCWGQTQYPTPCTRAAYFDWSHIIIAFPNKI